MTTRSGSTFLLCLALAAFAAMVGYAFLRGASRQEMSGKSEMLRALARDAASSGMAHAFEQILTDYNTRSLEVATGSGPVNLTPAPNFLDGPYRAPFVSLTAPNKLAYITSGKDDVNPRNHLLSVLMLQGEQVFHWWHDYQDGYANHSGATVYDARGRYIEVNYHNVARPSPDTANPVPVVVTRFTDPSAAVPERSNALFMDENLHRLVDGTVADRRKKARYRLRYAVGVEDLAGHLLTNPLPRMNTDWKDANNDYRAVPRWVDHAASALDNMVSSWNPNRATALRLGHIFRGRGNASNADRAWPRFANDPREGLPATFPMMFRSTSYNWHGIFQESRLYSFAGGKPWNLPTPLEPIKANPLGNEILTPRRTDPNPGWEELPYVHALTGPQLSWFSQIFSLQGSQMPWQGNAGWEQGSETHRSYLNTVYTPFGHAQRVSTAPPAQWKWYEGRVDTPWHVNLLTAAPEVISEMLLAYIPPHLKTAHWTHEEYYEKTGVDANGDVFSPTETLARRNTNGGRGWNNYSGIELQNDQLSPGFSEFPAQSSLLPDGVTVVKPDYYQSPAETRPVEQRYPGPLCRSDSALGMQNDDGRVDDLGKLVDVDMAMNEPSALTVGWCTHTYNPLLFFKISAADQTRIWDEVSTPSLGPWPKTPRWKIIRRLDPLRLPYNSYSYFWDMTYALSTTLAYARAVWVQYPNDVFDPRPTAPMTTGFRNALGTGRDNSLRDPLAYDTIEEIDALFLRQMGENFAVPGTRNGKNPIIAKHTGGLLAFQEATKQVSNTIASLVAGDLLKTATASSAERGKVLERMLNDYRMSFFGASTHYVDFRPLDFDGDGKVHCSCYDANTAASHEEKLYRTNRWMPAGAGGKGPSPSDLTAPFDATLSAAPYNYPAPDPTLGRSPWFCATGCFFIGKSHYYRIFSRGEVYDNLLQKPVAQQTLETVLTVDPEAPRFAPAGRISTEQRVLFKQWHHNQHIIELPLQMR